MTTKQENIITSKRFNRRSFLQTSAAIGAAATLSVNFFQLAGVWGLSKYLSLAAAIAAIFSSTAI